MQKLTITVNDKLYKALYAEVGKGKISRFADDTMTKALKEKQLEASYREMATDVEREKEAMEWCEGLIADVGNEPW